MSQGQGSISYSTPATTTGGGGGGTVTAANDGLSLDGTGAIVQLGQQVATALDPAKLLQNREVPLNGKTLAFRHTIGNDDVTIGAGSITIEGKGSIDGVPSILMNNLEGLFPAATIMLEQTFLTIDLDATLYWVLDISLGRLRAVGDPLEVESIEPAIKTISANYIFGLHDCTLVVDTSGGNVGITVSPSLLKATGGHGRLCYIKKKGTDANSVTITPSSGSIYADAGAAASYVFSFPGESITFQSDGTNLYVL
jgi:hypothetical protein